MGYQSQPMTRAHIHFSVFDYGASYEGPDWQQARMEEQSNS